MAHLSSHTLPPHPSHLHSPLIPSPLTPSHLLQCGPCRVFTPELVKTYNKVKEATKNFEIIFVSSDRDEESMMEYFGEMPWLAIPFDDPRKKTLARLFDVSGT